MAAIITPAELASHSKPDDLWVAVDGTVYDLGDFSDVRGVDDARLGLSCCLLLARCALRGAVRRNARLRAPAPRGQRPAQSFRCTAVRSGRGREASDPG